MIQDENKSELACKAIILFLKSLPTDCHVNVIEFGSIHQVLFNDMTAVYSETNPQKAEKLTNPMKTDLGSIDLVGFILFLEESRDLCVHLFIF